MRKLAILSICLSTSVMAKSSLSDVIFSCATNEGKPILVKKVGEDYILTYDQISIRNPIKQVINHNDSFIAGGSGFITSSLELKDSDTSYTIQFSQPRNNLKKLDGVEIFISKGESLKSIECNSQEKISHNFNKKIMRKVGFSL